jgi:mannose-6-phosphate isomerase-like protein (cupin superfamily)
VGTAPADPSELSSRTTNKTHPHAGASFAKFTLGVGGALGVHRHDKTEEFAYFIAGEGVAVFVDENGAESLVPVATGYVWYNPPGQWHAVRNTGSVPLSLVFATVPNEEKGLMSFFRRIGSTPGKQGTPLSLEELQRIGAEHDMHLRGPDDE